MYAVYSRTDGKKRWQHVTTVGEKKEAESRAQAAADEQGQSMISVTVGVAKKTMPASYNGGMRFERKKDTRTIEDMLRQVGDSQKAVDSQAKEVRSRQREQNPIQAIAKMFGIGSDDRPSTVKETLPMRPEWARIVKEAEDAKSQMEDLHYKVQHLHRKLWYQIESDTGIYRQMRLSDDRQSILVLEDE